jgi:Sec7-like guanine-nucleotide exchange factor
MVSHGTERNDQANHGTIDQAYVLAFSLIMLHTDAFNKSNKRKMTKADYVKNTRLPGVPPEVLEVRTFPCS